MSRIRRLAATALALAIAGGSAIGFAHAAEIRILNVSYDPTRELYKEFDAAFAAYWKGKTGDDVVVEQSHAGSGAQARAVIDGLEADVLTLALEGDIDKVAAKGLMPTDWRDKLPHNSTPYTSTIVFLVRKGNPKGINDWGDLIKDGVEVITPNPKTSGGAQWNFLAAWAWANDKFGGDEAKTVEFVTRLYKHVPVLDSGARGSTTTFVQREIGDVLLAWENEAFLAINELGPDKFNIVVPPLSVRADPPVALVAANAEKHGTTEVARAYLNHLYSDEGQKIIARHFYRPAEPEKANAEDLERFADVKLVSIDDPALGGWARVTPRFFANGGIFDSIYKPAN